MSLRLFCFPIRAPFSLQENRGLAASAIALAAVEVGAVRWDDNEGCHRMCGTGESDDEPSAVGDFRTIFRQSN